METFPFDLSFRESASIVETILEPHLLKRYYEIAPRSLLHRIATCNVPDIVDWSRRARRNGGLVWPDLYLLKDGVSPKDQQVFDALDSRVDLYLRTMEVVYLGMELRKNP